MGDRPSSFTRSRSAALAKQQPQEQLFDTHPEVSLDFDIVQLARTSIPDGDHRQEALRARLCDYADDIIGFYDTKLDGDYKLHKLPGGLATLHECALAVKLPEVPGLEMAPMDIAREAYWI